VNHSSPLSNQILLLTVFSGLAVQALKVLVVWWGEKRVNFRVFVQTGGILSSHCASVATLSTLVGLREGFGSALFGVTAFFSFIVMYDAAGLRRAAGRQATVLNRIVDDLKLGRVGERRLRELLGHTPTEVLAGALFGVAFALIFGRVP
jgi:acid phosphatase family membrane protein YuiD